jgi:hypothetical protein
MKISGPSFWRSQVAAMVDWQKYLLIWGQLPMTGRTEMASQR